MRNPKTLKKQNYVFATESCISCIHKNQCVRCSTLNQPPRQVLLHFLGFRKKPTKEMLEGIKRHKIFFGHLKELEEYGIKNFFKDLYQGKEINIAEGNFCSPSWGLRGHIDALKILYNPKEKGYTFEIIELKPSWSKEYIFQIAAYAALLSDPLCKIIYKKKLKKEHFITRNLYPSTPFKTNVYCRFIYYKTGKEHIIKGEENNELKRFTNCLFRRIKNIRKFMRPGFNLLSNYPKCSFCDFIKCEFKDICERYPFVRSKQMHLGKKKFLVK